MKKSELIHWRLQAMLREHTFSDLQYLGVRPDSIGVDQHWYRIGEAEIPRIVTGKHRLQSPMD